MLVAHSIFLCEPYVIGKTIDGLIHKNYTWLYVFLGIEVFANIFIYRRMVFDTKVYSKIYNNFVSEYVESDTTSTNSSKIARTEMAQNIVTFMENDVQYIIMSIVSIIGSLFFIASMNFSVLPLALLYTKALNVEIMFTGTNCSYK